MSSPTGEGRLPNQEPDQEDRRWSLFTVGAVVMIVTAAIVGGITYVSTSGYEHATEIGYVGPERCHDCHPDQYASWADTRMATSFEVLRPGQKVEEKKLAGLDPDEDYTQDQTCLPCHTTGYGLVGGFTSFEETPRMAGVTCEACHGPGGRYAGTVMNKSDPSFQTAVAREAGLVYPPTARVCRRCHNEDSPFAGSDYKFDYEERVSKGTHEHFALDYKHGG